MNVPSTPDTAKPMTWERIKVVPASPGELHPTAMLRAHVPGGYLVMTKWGNEPAHVVFVPSTPTPWLVETI